MKIDFFGVSIDAITMEETIKLVDQTIQTNGQINHSCINAAKVVMMLKDNDLYKSIVSSNFISADGQSIVWAARFMGKNIPERVAGADLMQNLVKLSFEKKYKCFFFGASEEVVRKVVETYTEQYGAEVIAGYRNGYYLLEEEPLIARQIANCNTQLLFVAMSSPKKEIFLNKYNEILKNVNFAMGVGGTFDVIAGITKRAPVWMQKVGLEWFYRFLQEPRRMWKRYLIGNSKFIWYVFKEKVRQAI